MRKYDFWIGIFALIAIISVIFLALKASNLSNQLSQKDSYEVHIPFTNIGGLRLRAPVNIAGVTIGRVVSIKLDDSFNAIVTLRIEKRYDKIPSDSEVAIRTKGLLGEQFVSVSAAFAGFEEDYWINNFEVSPRYVRPALQIDELIGQALFKGE